MTDLFYLILVFSGNFLNGTRLTVIVEAILNLINKYK